jgi:hypothetical protein
MEQGSLVGQGRFADLQKLESALAPLMPRSDQGREQPIEISPLP